MTNDDDARAALAEFQRDLSESDSQELMLEPLAPGEWLTIVMAQQKVSVDDAARRSGRVSGGLIRKLADGSESFTREIIGELRPWLGEKTSVLEGIVADYNYWQENRRQRPRAVVEDTHENRMTALAYRASKRRGSLEIGPRLG